MAAKGARKEAEEANATELPVGEGWSIVGGRRRRTVYVITRICGVVGPARRAGLESDSAKVGTLLKACGHSWQVLASVWTIHGGNEVI